MPCSDGMGVYGTNHTVYVEKGTQTSRLCAVFTVLENRGLLDSVLSQANWKESGVSKASTLDWWARHKEEDRQRRQREAAETARKRARSAILSKLTPAEKKILGVKE